jgi:hypothetical protein
MAAKGVTWRGLDEFKRELRAATPDLVSEANAILVSAAEVSKDRVYATYPRGKTGRLRRGLVVKPSRGSRLLAGAKVQSRAPYSHLYEDGTAVRQTKQGYNRGAAPAHPTFKPITDAGRRQALYDVISLLYAHGAARVSGDPDTED